MTDSSIQHALFVDLRSLMNNNKQTVARNLTVVSGCITSLLSAIEAGFNVELISVCMFNKSTMNFT